ncbi:MAG: phosphoribosylaminoimidazolesuccinocarboxamide synthase [Ilumatobacteraceae bacterium]
MPDPFLPDPFLNVDLDLPDRRVGKVRVSYALGDRHRLFVTTDRLSAFDRIISGVPWKGQVLNQLAAWWFASTSDIVANHVATGRVALPDPNVLVAVAATPLPVEVIVRGYITGVTSTSLWKRYADGAREIYGYRFPDGLHKNTPLPTAIITPTTKAEAGAHDEALTVAEVTESGLVASKLWDEVQAAALAVFARGQQVAASAGLILADTKYEFGLTPDGSLLLIDEMHTPDSSRFWVADSYEERLAAGEEPESLDKEVIRRALADAGYSGDGPPPELDPSIWQATTARYIDTFERLTGETFVKADYPVGPRIAVALAKVSG